jgi:hypothetical protein
VATPSRRAAAVLSRQLQPSTASASASAKPHADDDVVCRQVRGPRGNDHAARRTWTVQLHTRRATCRQAHTPHVIAEKHYLAQQISYLHRARTRGRRHRSSTRLCGSDNARAATLADRLACDRDGLDVVRPAMSRCNRQCLLLRQEQWARRQPRQRSSTPSHRLTSTSWTPRSRHALCSSAYARDAPQMHYRGGELHVGRADSSGSIALVVTDRVTAYHATSVMHISAEAALQRNTASPSSERASAMRSHPQQGAVTHLALAGLAPMAEQAL